MQKLFILIFGLCSSLLSAKSNISVGIDSIYRTYSEKFVKPLKSDEYGSILGVYLGYELASDKLYLNSAISIYGGTTDYEGALQDTSGKYVGDHNDKTLNVLLDICVDVGYKLPIGSFVFIPYTSFGYHKWSRLLHDGLAVLSPSSYDEFYSWFYLGLGSKLKIYLNEKISIEFDMSVRSMLSGKMEVKNHSILNLDQGSVDLGNKWHYLLSSTFNILISEEYFLHFTPHFEFRPIGQSNFNKTYRYSEPSSTTYTGGVKIGMTFVL